MEVEMSVVKEGLATLKAAIRLFEVIDFEFLSQLFTVPSTYLTMRETVPLIS